MTVSRNKLTKQDINKMSLYSVIEQSCFSFERMQAAGFTLSMVPTFKKIYGDQKEEIAAAMMNNMDFINTEPHMATFLMGLIVSLEEAGEDREMIKGIKTGLFGPLAGLGDAIFWFTLLPISAAICCSIAKDGSVLGPLLYIGIWFVAAISRIWFGRLGYTLGVNAVSTISENANAITKAAGILGVMVVGGLIPSYVSLEFAKKLTVAGGVNVQGVFDGILPNVLPLGFVFLLYWLFKKKNANVIVIILGIIVFSIGMSYLGWM
ncbi:PTS N-acetylgalactosamine transporter subunit IID [Clostridiaceae bacterium DONG20-135]|uniref:PTS N-acetylgalactosamine transporter subunit IID n=1 Tax=Copranaerobaculum intestinale TaxID=2692629 RepID=A0A6N8U819_9FIRM|nr:PTS system mannose/fructose/sorbose family transporter subunit IID [Copranaerobaculum intestinale]MXQ74132.1 PTS N-acetylgalactosamine transporter subunit IID [Copranaerobaculum intestinale]